MSPGHYSLTRHGRTTRRDVLVTRLYSVSVHTVEGSMNLSSEIRPLWTTRKGNGPTRMVVPNGHPESPLKLTNNATPDGH